MEICKNCGKPLILSGGKCLYCGAAANRKEQLKKAYDDRPSPFRRFEVDGAPFKMVLVEGGSFYMGLTPKEAQFYINNGIDWRRKHPIVKVDSFYIGETEVTQALWKVVMNRSPVTPAVWRSALSDMNNPSMFKGDNLPVENVSWNNCQEFIEKLNAILGVKFRLPSEAEWEFASKGGNASKGYEFSGSDNLREVAWTRGDVYAPEPKLTTHPVKTKKPNELGLYDMTGNVWEWTADEFDEKSVVEHGDHIGNEMSSESYPSYRGYKIMRGFSAVFSFNDTIIHYPSYRNYVHPCKRSPILSDTGYKYTGWSYDAYGFRLALSVGNRQD